MGKRDELDVCQKELGSIREQAQKELGSIREQADLLAKSNEVKQRRVEHLEKETLDLNQETEGLQVGYKLKRN